MVKFRRIDIIIFAILAGVSHYLCIKYGNEMYTPYFYSLKTIVLIVMLLRWGRYAIPGVLLANCFMIFSSEMEIINFVIYEVLAGAFIALPIVIYWNRDRNLLIKGKLKFVLVIILSHLSLCIGKGIAIYIIEGVGTGFQDYLASTLFIMTIDILVGFLLRAVKGLVVDMEKYDLVSDEV